MPFPKTITMPEIVTLFRRELGISCKPTNIYYYMHKHGFPKPIPLGCPRKWIKKPVEHWFAKQVKKHIKV